MRSFKQFLIFSLGLLFFLAGCQAPVYHQSQANIGEDLDYIASHKRELANKLKAPGPLVINQGQYVDKTPINLVKQPTWLKNHIVIRGDQLPFSYYTRVMAGGAGKTILTRYQTGMTDDTKLSINYSGTVRGALDLIAAKTGYEYTIRENDIYWQSIITRTFDIAFMPGSSDYMMGKSSSSGTSSGGTTSSAGGSSVTAIIDDSAASQYSNIKGKLSIWQDLDTAIKQMLSPAGKSLVSQSTTSVTVRDYPTNIRLIGKFINNLNKTLSRQVLVKVEILTVSLENDFELGINWNIVQRAINHGTYQLVANNGSPISLTSSVGLSTSGASIGFNSDQLAGSTGMTGVISLINALQQQGKVSVVTQPQVLCQNNQVSAIRILDQQGYLASVQTTSGVGGSSSSSTATNTVTSQLTPGAVLTGLTLYVLPKILGQKVYMQVNADFSQNLGIQNIASNGASASQLTPTSQVSIIQVPHITQKQFNQRSVVRSGDTIILSGFRQIVNSTGASQLLGSDALGGKAAQQANQETIVLITPIVLPGIA